jgi:RNA polymerase sigma-70 factor (ECF subfamily)
MNHQPSTIPPSSPDPDRALVERIRSGEDRAFNDLMARYKKPVLNFLYRIVGSADDADDLAQETFVRCYRNLAKFEFRRARFSTWLFQLARNAAIDHLRRRKKENFQPLENLGEKLPRIGNNPSDQADLSDLAAAIAAAVAQLPEDQRTALVLSEYQGQSHAEISTVMDCSEKSVESRLYRARQALREKLKRWMP